MSSEDSGPSGRNSRSRLGCLSCRNARVKCDENRPACSRCVAKSVPCEWPTVTSTPRKQRNPRHIKSCDACRRLKARCSGISDATCDGCRVRRIPCVWTTRQPSTTPSIDHGAGPASDRFHTTSATLDTPFTFPQGPIPLADTSIALTSDNVQQGEPDIGDLLKLYFCTVHHFGLLNFIHESDFWQRYEQGKIPQSLIRIMAANALRFGNLPHNPHHLSIADSWAMDAGDKLLSTVFNEFGAIELMAGRYSRGWLMAGMAARMMTFLRLHVFDETPHPVRKPLLSAESLRRLAWSVWFLDATIDGGNFGFSAIAPGALTIQLPCDERPFALHQNVVTEPLTPAGQSNLGLSAHLIRAMHARQLYADAHSRLQRGMVVDLVVETNAAAILDALPAEMAYGPIQYHAFRDQRPLLVHLHVMRNTCQRHSALLQLLVIKKTDGDASIQRERLIQIARELCTILADALKYQVVLDPQIAMHAYNAIETLLFQPLQTPHLIGKDEIASCLKPLLTVIRHLSQSSALVALIHPEAVNRMIRLGYTDDITNDDVMAVLQKVHRLTNVDSEFDFNESFWRYELSLSRAPEIQSPDDRLLETHPDPPHIAQDPITRLQSFLASNSRRGSPSRQDDSGQGDPSQLGDIGMMLNLQPSEEAFPMPWLGHAADF